MNLIEAQKHLVAGDHGRGVRREGWGGYWSLEEDGTLCICLKDGRELGRDYPESIDWSETVTHMGANDWELVPSIVETEHYLNWLNSIWS